MKTIHEFTNRVHVFVVALLSALVFLTPSGLGQEAMSDMEQPPDLVTPGEGEGEGTGGEGLDQLGGAGALASLQTDMFPTGTGSARAPGDIMNFQTDLFTGRFTYRVPILVPPARGGSQPDISLRYSSSAGNGWCGVGWLLDLGYIERDTSQGVPRKWSGASPLNEYDDAYGFVFSAQGAKSRLVNMGGNEYRAEVETGAFLKFVYVNPSWEVTDKSGNKFYYGEATASRMENTKFTAGLGKSTFRWAISRARDVNGNETSVTYTKDNNQLYPSQVSYNANVNTPTIAATHTVSFVLEDRVDKMIDFLGGYRVETRKRLKEIQVKISATNVRKYVLGYTSSASTYRSMLSSVTQYGSDFATALPPLTFTYQTQAFEFDSLTDWLPLNSLGATNSGWNSVRARNGDLSTYVEFGDCDNDGFPDRVLRHWWREWDPELQRWWGWVSWYYQQNTGTNFNQTLSSFSSVYSPNPADESWSSIRSYETAATKVEFADLNADNLPDRFMRAYSSPYTTWTVQYNLGAGVLSSAYSIGPITNESSSADWRSIRATFPTNYVDFIDINGDALPDRVARKLNSSYDRFKVQFGTGAGFGSLVDWGTLDSQGQPNDTGWNSVYAKNAGGATFVGLYDLNGDGLPDRVMRKLISPYNNFIVQFNNGAGFETAENWGPLNSQGQTSGGWNSPIGTSGLLDTETYSTLADINGDGLLDRVMRKVDSPYDRFRVQLNTGTGFTNSLVDWTSVSSEAGSSSAPWNSVVAVTNGESYVEFVDINGDALPDRVMRKYSSPYDRFKVQLNKGPFPDLLSTIQNGIGGKVQVNYMPSTKYDNRDGTAASRLGYPFYTVSSVVVYDGFGNADTTTYAYAGGVGTPREFAGFNRVTVTDPLGTATVTYFHQGGGTNDTVNGEYNDEGSRAKKGMPYRVELWGADGLKYRQTINKVDERPLHTNGWSFAFIAQSILMDYEGLGNYRAKAQQFFYDASSNVVASTGNLTNQVNLGEVSGVDVATHSFTDTGSDSLFTRLAYNSLAKPTNVTVFADSAGTVKLRETRLTYDARGNPTAQLQWLNTTGSYVTNSIGYDQYGNVTLTTNAVGIASRTLYDTTYRVFPITQITATFTNQAGFDIRSGQIVTATDVKGLVSSNAFDVFFRPTAGYISTNAFGAAVLWRAKLDYNLGGVTNGVSSNYVRRRVYDAMDLTNGHETYTYADGLGRVAQVRAEAETANQYRVSDTFYNERGNAEFVTLPYFSSGTTFTTDGVNQLGALNYYDFIGRVASNCSPAYATGAPADDTDSPVGKTKYAYKDGTNPWITVVTDPKNNSRKASHDAYGRAIQIVEVTSGGDYNTYYGFDKVGNLTNVTDNANNKTWMNYDSLGRKTSMTEPNMGTWSYTYDAAGRMTQQTDAKNQTLLFYYNDAIGRLTSKEIYDSGSSLVATISYTYDTSDDQAYTVFKGQLYKVTDRQGWQKHSYDVRGRVLKTGRYLSVNSQTYVTQNSYDDADRLSQLTYPGNATRIQYTYDTGGNLRRAESLCGTGTNEVFYTLGALTALGQISSYTNGNGVATAYTYYSNSKRLDRIQTVKGGTTLQNLHYTYDKAANIKSITDSVYSGTQGGALSNVNYDDLYRLTSYTWNGTTYNFSYNAIGNMTLNNEFGAGSYTYGSSKPHAVTSANGKLYSYDACGNMTNRNGQVLSYDQENQLTQAGTVTFGYADGGARLWKNNGGQLTVWIGSIYEIKGGKTLCHVIAGGRRVATFEPISPGCAWLQNTPGVREVYAFAQAATTWPLQRDRTPLTVMLIPLVGILGGSIWSRRRSGHFGSGVPGAIARRFSRQWSDYLSGDPIASSPARHFIVSLISVTLIVALFFVTTETMVQAATYDPVFYYYHGDHLGSSNILTDRQGNLVDHYENTAFGKERYNEASPAFAVSHRYTGQIFDDDTGLYYYNARYYDPELGRFIQADTVVPEPSDPQSINRYSYVLNNPLKYVDPSGHGIASFFKRLVEKVRSGFGGIYPPPPPPASTWGGNWRLLYWDRTSASGQAYIADYYAKRNAEKMFELGPFTLQGTAVLESGLQFPGVSFDTVYASSYAILSSSYSNFAFDQKGLLAPVGENSVFGGMEEMMEIISIADDVQSTNYGVVFGSILSLSFHACSEQAADAMQAINSRTFQYWLPARITGGFNSAGMPHHVVLVSPSPLGVSYGFHDFVIDPYVKFLPISSIPYYSANEFFRSYGYRTSWLFKPDTIEYSAPVNP